MSNAVGLPEILVIVVVALIVFGPDKLPDMARKGAQWLAKFREQASAAVDELRQAADIGDIEQEVKAVSADMRRMRDQITKPAAAQLDEPRKPDEAPPIDLEAT